MMKTRFVLMLLPLALSARPLDIRSPNLEPSRGAKPRPPIMVPVGCEKLLSSGCAVSSSDTQADSEALAVITDGNKECGEGVSVKLAPGLQWVQIDLGKTQSVYAVFIWRALPQPHVCRDVVIQLSTDVMFKENVETVFNNDHDNTAGLGVGTDKEYIETLMGRSIPVNGVKARYVRVYSNGSIMDQGKTYDFNHYTEIEVYGDPCAGKGEAYTPLPVEKTPIRVRLPKPQRF